MSTYYGTCEICQMKECGDCNDNGFVDTNFLIKEVKERCSSCICLVVGNEGQWVCDEKQLPCMAISNCPEQNI